MGMKSMTAKGQGFGRLLWLLCVSLSLAACASKPIEETPHGPYRVGYAIHELDIHRADGRPLTVAVWYPTAEAPQHIVYGGPTGGNVALNARREITGRGGRGAT